MLRTLRARFNAAPMAPASQGIPGMGNSLGAAFGRVIVAFGADCSGALQTSLPEAAW